MVDAIGGLSARPLSAKCFAWPYLWSRRETGWL